MRLELSKRTDIGIRTLRLLSRLEPTSPISRSQLAEAIDTTPGFLPQAINPLIKRGWIDSRPGTNGGYSSRVDPAHISVLELIEAVEGPIDDQTCVLRDAECPNVAPCAMHHPWSRARDALKQELAATCVADCGDRAIHEGGDS